jgi:hypothetical protein
VPGSAVFSSVIICVGNSSIGGLCFGTGAVLCFDAVAKVCELGSAFFFFGLEVEAISPV